MSNSYIHDVLFWCACTILIFKCTSGDGISNSLLNRVDPSGNPIEETDGPVSMPTMTSVERVNATTVCFMLVKLINFMFIKFNGYREMNHLVVSLVLTTTIRWSCMQARRRSLGFASEEEVNMV